MVEEIGQFLVPSQRMDVRAVALAQVCNCLVTISQDIIVFPDTCFLNVATFLRKYLIVIAVIIPEIFPIIPRWHLKYYDCNL